MANYDGPPASVASPAQFLLGGDLGKIANTFIITKKAPHLFRLRG